MLHGVNDDLQDVIITVFSFFGDAYRVRLWVERTTCEELMKKNVEQWISDNLINVQSWVLEEW